MVAVSIGVRTGVVDTSRGELGWGGERSSIRSVVRLGRGGAVERFTAERVGDQFDRHRGGDGNGAHLADLDCSLADNVAAEDVVGATPAATRSSPAWCADARRPARNRGPGWKEEFPLGW